MHLPDDSATMHTGPVLHFEIAMTLCESDDVACLWPPWPMPTSKCMHGHILLFQRVCIGQCISAMPAFLMHYHDGQDQKQQASDASPDTLQHDPAGHINGRRLTCVSIACNITRQGCQHYMSMHRCAVLQQTTATSGMMPKVELNVSHCMATLVQGKVTGMLCVLTKDSSSQSCKGCSGLENASQLKQILF